MSDLIDRAEVMKLLDEQCWNGMLTLFRGEHHVNCFRELVKAIPSVENKGEWIEKEVFDGDTAYECSECGELFCLIDGTPADNLYNFCPNCGADMRGE